MRRWLTARSAAVRIQALRAVLRPYAASGEPVLLVAPTRSAADEALRLDVELSAALGVHRTSLRGLALDLAAAPLARAGRAPLSGLAQEAIAARALAEVELGGLDALKGAPGLPRALARTVEDLRRARIEPEALVGIEDLPELLGTYTQILESRGLADACEVLRYASGAPVSHRLLGRPLFLLDVAPADAAEEAFLRFISAACPSVQAVLSPTHPDRARLGAALGVETEEIDEPSPEDALGRARVHVFSEAAPPRGELDESLRFFSAPGEGRECVEIARAALRHAREGTPFDRMAVLLRDPGRYQPLLAEAFARAEISACFDRDLRQPDPSGRALLALLACASEELSAARFAEYLSLGEVPQPEPGTGAPPARKVAWVAPRDERQLAFFSVEPEPNAEPEAPEPAETPEAEPVVDGRLRAPHRWEQLLVDASVIGGAERWTRRLRGLRAELEARLRHLESEHPERAEPRRIELSDLGHLERFALPLVRKLSVLPARGARWGEWIDNLSDLAGQALRQPERVLRVLAELRVMKEVGPVSLDEVRLVLHDRLAFLREEDPDDQPYGRIWVGSLDACAGRSFEVVFLPGLAEGQFPRPSQEDPLLHDDRREALRSGFARRPRLAAAERERLRRALGVAERCLELSYPRVDTRKSRARVLSFYALDVLRAAEGRLPQVRTLERRATEATSAHLGWAAPLSPEDAVDAAEYDLSVLADRLRRQRDDEASVLAGAGRYLLEGADGPPNLALARALRARALRWRSRVGPHDGLVVTDEAQRAAFARMRLGARPYSATALETFAACPYRFYLSAIVRLRSREVPTRIERMDPRLRGILAHAALARWVARLEAHDLLPWESGEQEEVLRHVTLALEEEARALEEEVVPAIPELWARELSGLERDLRSWVRRVLNDPQGFFPTYAELGFGLSRPDQHPKSRPEPLLIPDPELEDEAWRLRGSIDLVETRPLDGRLRITDYKTGRRSRPEHDPEMIRGGRVVQPLLYAEAAERMLGAEVENARLAFCSARGGFASDPFSVGPQGRAALQSFLRTVDRSIREAHLPAAPGKGDCRFCDYRSICGTTEELRATKKAPESFELLQQVRQLP